MPTGGESSSTLPPVTRLSVTSSVGSNSFASWTTRPIPSLNSGALFHARTASSSSHWPTLKKRPGLRTSRKSRSVPAPGCSLAHDANFDQAATNASSFPASTSNLPDVKISYILSPGSRIRRVLPGRKSGPDAEPRQPRMNPDDLAEALRRRLPRAKRHRWLALARPRTANERAWLRSEEHTSELQSHSDLVCRLLLEKKKRRRIDHPAENRINNKHRRLQ